MLPEDIRLLANSRLPLIDLLEGPFNLEKVEKIAERLPLLHTIHLEMTVTFHVDWQ